MSGAAGDELSEQVMLRLSSAVLDQLKTVSKAQERTVAQTVRLAIRHYLQEHGPRGDQP